MLVQPFGWCLVGNDPPAIGNKPTKMGVTSVASAGPQPFQLHSSNHSRPSGNQQEGRGAAKGRTRGFSGRSTGRDRVLILLISVYRVWGEMACDNATSRQWPFLVHQKDQKDAVDSCRVCSGYVLCSGLDLAPAPVNLVSHKASGLCGGAWPHTLPSSASLDNANGWVSPYSPLPNLGNTCYIAAVLQMIRALGVAFPCSGDSWHATVQCLEQLGFFFGLQKDSRCFFGILVAQYPTWARQFSWLFGRQASCSTCGSVRDLPVDEQSVVDLPLVPGASHCLSTLLDTAVSSGEASLDCAACAGRKHHTLSGLSVANVRSSVFFSCAPFRKRCKVSLDCSHPFQYCVVWSHFSSHCCRDPHRRRP